MALTGQQFSHVLLSPTLRAHNTRGFILSLELISILPRLDSLYIGNIVPDDVRVAFAPSKSQARGLRWGDSDFIILTSALARLIFEWPRVAYVSLRTRLNTHHPRFCISHLLQS